MDVYDNLNTQTIAYGGISAQNDDELHLHSVTTSYSTLTGWEPESSIGFNVTSDITSGDLEIHSYGTFWGAFNICTIGTQNRVYEYRLIKNGSAITGGGTAQYGNTTGIRSLAFQSLFTAEAGDHVGIAVANNTGTSTLTIHETAFSIQQFPH
jgi:hypothetical protein